MRTKLSCTIQMKREYRLGKPIDLEFTLKNETDEDHWVLNWNTPLEGLQSHILSISKDGSTVPYDGILMKRGEAPAASYERLPAGGTLTRSIDISTAYSIAAGSYRVRLETRVLDHYPAAGRRKAIARSIDEQEGHDLLSNTVRFVVTVGHKPRQTTGEAARAKEKKQKAISQKGIGKTKAPSRKATNRPLSALNPTFIGGNNGQRSDTLNAHRGATVFCWAALQSLSNASSSNYTRWFGASTPARATTVRSHFQNIYQALTTQAITYSFNGDQCQPGTYAYTYPGTRTVYLCGAYLAASFSGKDSKLGTLIHELSHATSFTVDTVYGRQGALNLASSNPAKAVNNADNHEYFAETTFPFDYGVDAAVKLRNGKSFLTLGSIYVRYSDNNASTVDASYPLPLAGNWGNLPGSFQQGFDSAFVLPNGKTYVTKDGQYLRYSDAGANTVDSGYPKAIAGNWGAIPPDFNLGFDSGFVLRNGKTYITRGPLYVRYSDSGAGTVDPGYPRPIAGNWGSIPAEFNTGFDAGVVLPNNKTYIFKGGRYVRYSDASASTVDSGYPKSMAGNWGNIPDAAALKRTKSLSRMRIPKRKAA